ncbi:MAG: hypothetical protein JJ913_07215 [Rhizobiaceae bacterium]|nr:hypothetical protein [Rhizobiaceae bacterium]
MKAATAQEMTPEMLAESDTHTKAEKLGLLEAMRRDALKKREDGDLAASDAEATIGSIDSAIETVKREQENAGIALGRTPSA